MHKKGFTVLELLMVVLLIGILASFAVPAYRNLKERSYAVEAYNWIDTLKTQVQHYKSVHGIYPMGDQLLEEFPFPIRLGGSYPSEFVDPNDAAIFHWAISVYTFNYPIGQIGCTISTFRSALENPSPLSLETPIGYRIDIVNGIVVAEYELYLGHTWALKT